MRKTLALVGVLLAVALVAWRWRSQEEAAPAWRTEALRKADITATVSATGNLEAVTTVEVGTQVSGIVAELLVDFNDPVKAGQLIARIDPALLLAGVESAAAEHDLARASLALAQQELTRVETLRPLGAATQAELDTARMTRDVAQAQLRGAVVALDRARANLGYAQIRSPIDGTVIRRDVDLGQTVNAGTSAPTLFLIAGDLSRMQILAAVDEADIAKVKEGQEVRFTVAAHGERRFEGRVQQVRLMSTLTENVVTYAVVVSVDNQEGLLKPGMTATVDFVVETAKDALCAPSAALRFRPEPEQLIPEAQASRSNKRERRRGPSREGSLHLVTPQGLRPLTVQLGAADRECTAVSGEGVEEGLEVVTGAPISAEEGGGGLLQTGASRSRPGGF